VSSLRSTYRAISDRLTARLDEPSLRRWVSTVDIAAGVSAGLVAIGLWFETKTFWSAAGLVTIGVCGEFVTHWLHMRAFKRAEELSDEKTRAGELEIARLSQAAAEANKKAAEAWERVSWRTITDERRAVLLDKLSPLAGQPIIVVLACVEGESANFARQVSDLFREAGWAVRPAFAYAVGDELMLRASAVWNGLRIDSNFAGRGAWLGREDEEQRLLEVTNFLAQVFTEQGFEATPIGAPPQIGPAVPEPPETSLIRIRVCRKS